jgi:hypothetical protein
MARTNNIRLRVRFVSDVGVCDVNVCDANVVMPMFDANVRQQACIEILSALIASSNSLRIKSNQKE